MRATIEDLRYALEGLLTGSIPYLELEHLLLKFNQECSELHTHRHLVISHELVVRQSVKETRFANRRVSNDNELK